MLSIWILHQHGRAHLFTPPEGLTCSCAVPAGQEWSTGLCVMVLKKQHTKKTPIAQLSLLHLRQRWFRAGSFPALQRLFLAPSFLKILVAGDFYPTRWWLVLASCKQHLGQAWSCCRQTLHAHTARGGRGTSPSWAGMNHIRGDKGTLRAFTPGTAPHW